LTQAELVRLPPFSERDATSSKTPHASPPTRLIGHNPVGLAHGLPDGLVNWFAARGGPQYGVDAAAATKGDTEEAL
jgi:hypothetical protein